MPWSGHSSRVLSSAVIFVGVVVLLSSAFCSWYSTQLSSSDGVIGQNFYLTGVQLFGDWNEGPYSYSTTFGAVSLPTTGQLYGYVGILVVLGVISSGAAASWLLVRGRQPDRRVSSILVIAAALLAISGPSLLLVAQPAALCSDTVYFSPPLGSTSNTNATPSSTCNWALVTPGGPNSGYAWIEGGPPGPEASFFGSGVVQEGNHTWGPSIGWFLAVSGGSLIVVGAFVALAGARSEATAEGDAESSRTKTPPVDGGRGD